MQRSQNRIDQMDARLARVRRKYAALAVCLYARDSDTGQFEPARGRFVDEDDSLIALCANGERLEIGTVRDLEAAQRRELMGKWIVGPISGAIVIAGLAGILRACA